LFQGETGEIDMAKKKINTDRVIPKFADEALRLAKGDRKAAYSQYILLMYKATGRPVPGCDNRELQAYYDMKGGIGDA
jgi:hypothetical protein